MHVGNTVATFTGADATAGMSGGKSATPQPDGFGALLATELTGMLENIQADTIDTILPATTEKDEHETDLSDLLAMLDQLLQNGTVSLVPHQAVEQATQQAQTAIAVESHATVGLQPNDKEQVVAAFVQQGMDEQGAKQIADLLEAFAKVQATDQQPQLKQVTQQAAAILAKFGVDVLQTVQPEVVQKDTDVSFSTSKKNGTTLAKDMRFSPINQFQPTAQTNLLPHQVSAALSKYQPGLIIKPNQAQIPLDQLLQEAAQTVAESATQAGDDAQATSTFAGNLQQAVQTPVQGTNNPAVQTNGELVRAEHLPKDMANLFVKQMKIVGANGISEAKLVLHPQALGQVDVKITANNHVITAQFAADTQAGKELLDNQLPQLRAALTQLGLQVDKLEVTQQQSSQQPQFGFQQQREGQQNQQGRQQKQSKDEGVEFNIDELAESNSVDSWIAAKQAKVEYSV